jgi:PASTA domain
VFHMVAQEALRVLDVPKDLPDEPSAPVEVNKKDVNDLSIADLDSSEPNILEDGDDDDADGQPGNPAVGPRVPNFRGMTMRAVLAEAASKGMIVVASGSGVARLQDPPAGAPLREGERIRVQFAR